MHHGRYMGYGFYGSYILSSIVFILIITLLIVLVINKQKKSHGYEESIKILKERYVKDEISADEFREKRIVIDELEGSNPLLVTLVDRYVKGEIDTKEFFIIKNEIEKK